MPRFAANLTLMFTEWSFLDRFEAAAQAGFTAVEFLFPYEYPPEAIADRLGRTGLTQALFNMPPGNWTAGERGLASLPERFDELKESVRTALVYAAATGVKRLHLMAGIADRETPTAVAAFRSAVVWAAGVLDQNGLDLLIEPINRRDVPGYFLNDFVFAEELIRDLALPNLKLQFDIYHRQIIHGDVTMDLRRVMPIIGHVQIASVPRAMNRGVRSSMIRSCSMNSIGSAMAVLSGASTARARLRSKALAGSRLMRRRSLGPQEAARDALAWLHCG
jgi:hydroxypyruvate isomerase